MSTTESCFVKITILVMLFSSMLSWLSPVEALSPPVPKPKVNVTEILGGKPQFSTFLSLLNQTGLAKDIAPRETITILAVDNGAIGGLASAPLSMIKDTLSTHVILDYYDILKLSTLSPKKNTTVTTMYQATGVAQYMQGYLNIIALPNVGTKPKNKIRIGSAVRGSPVNVQVLGDIEVAAHPFDYVVLQVSGVIFTPGIDGSIQPPTSAPKGSPVAPPPHNKNTTTPAPSPDGDEDDYDTAPEAAPPTAEAPAPSSPSPSGSAADAPTADDDNAAASPPKKSSAMHISSSSAYCFTALVAVLVSSLFASAGL